MKFENKVVIITGAARGLGQEYARQFARRGARVVVCDIRDCSETLALIKEEGAAGLSVKTDVTSASSTVKMAEAAIDEFGGVDVLINNAALYGSLKFAPLEQLDEAEWDAAMNVNVKGIWQCTKAVLPSMKERGGGAIVNI
ncbi:MAG: SDR family NAD(P)-dependent oxidoreductase, partial [Woeseia sp.]|nr:SDR family NAD(P)-dependent oxidoreductase [Woeseia sp.]